MSITVFTKENVNINRDAPINHCRQAVNIKIRTLNRLSAFSCINYSFGPSTKEANVRKLDIQRLISELLDIADPYWWIVNKDLDYTIESILVQNGGPYRVLANS
jgi:hypothetical protein